MMTALLLVGMAVYTALKSYDKVHEQERKAVLKDQSLPKRTAPAGKSVLSEEEQVVDRELKLALGALGLTTAGVFAYPLLTLIGVPLLVYQVIPVIRLAYEELVKERKVGGNVVRALFRIILLALGAFEIAALWGFCIGALKNSCSLCKTSPDNDCLPPLAGGHVLFGCNMEM